MASVLSSFFSRDPKANFAYALPTEAFTSVNGIQIGKSFKKAEPAETATCFWTGGDAYALRTQIQKLRTLRHPNVLTYLDSIELDNAVYLITEPCRPLKVYVEEAELTAAQRELVVSWGLYQILSGLKFLHNECKITQGNMKDAIFVTESGDWKLSSFHNTQTFQSPKTDLNDLAVAIWQIFNGFYVNVDTKSLGKIPKRLQGLYKKLDSQRQTFTAGDLLADSRAVGGFMKNKFVDTLLFLEEFQLKESSEKQSFFVHLKDGLSMFPDDIAKYKILPKLIHTYEYGDAGSHILIPMFKLGRLLDEDEYQRRIVPCLVKLFSSPDRTTRVKLLEKIDEFAPHLQSPVVNDKIYPNIVTGFLDTNPAVREATVKAMVSLAEKLSYHNLNTDVMKYLARLQGADDQPGIRTNTTICLGKIGCYIDPSQRQKILISAFTRALRDPFPPARMSGVLALGATQQFYSLREVATRVLPALAPLTVDPEKQVRDQGFKALHGFLEKLEKASENPALIPEFEAQVNAGGTSGLISSDKVPQWAGWAIKAISGKFYKSTTPGPEGTPTSGTPTPGSGGPTATPAVTVPASNPSRPVSSAAESDGWGNDDSLAEGWDDAKDETDDDAAESWATRARSMEKSLSPVAKSAANANATGWDNDEGDDEDWGNDDWLKPQSTPSPVSTKKPPAAETRKPTKLTLGGGKGALKLSGSSSARASPADDLAELFGDVVQPIGVTPKPSVAKPAASASKPVTKKASDWDAEIEGDGWGDGWGDSAPAAAPVAAPPKAVDRKAEIAARNEARRKELAAKRAQKSSALKLGSTTAKHN